MRRFLFSILCVITFAVSPLPGRDASQGDTPSSTDKKEKQRQPKRELPATVSLCDGRTLKGRVYLEIPDTLLFTHTVDGLEFIKKVRVADIKGIEFERWTPVEQGKGKDGRVYRFDVSRYRVELAGSTLIVEKPIPPFFHKMQFSNHNGDILLYSFWMDLLRKDNTWFTGIQGPPSGERAFCHKDVIKKISFGKE